MLVVTRKQEQGIWLEIPGFEPVHITIVEVDRGRVKVGVMAERQIGIYRDEIFTRVLQGRSETRTGGEPCPSHLSPPSPLSMPVSQP